MIHPVDALASHVFDQSEAKAIPFQKQVYDALAANKSIVLQAPTGSGKTFAALAPFILDTWGQDGGPAARKLIYSLPLRVLAGTLRKEYEKIFSKSKQKLHFTNQYGGAAEDPFLDGGDKFWKPKDDTDQKDTSVKHIIFTTIDQTLSGFIGTPVGVSRRQANMVYGSILSGALVFDEFHLLKVDNFDSKSKGWSFGTALHLLRKTPWPFLIMTATMSSKLRELIATNFNAQSIVVDDKDLPYIRSQHETVKHLIVEKRPINGAFIADKLGKRTLVICNTVQRAQQVYEELCEELEKRHIKRKCLLLHSRFLPEHRAEKETSVSQWFKEDSDEEAIIIATQVVEAGLNISCDVMHTEISPIDSFLQRIGRAARFSSERTADIYVYPLPDPSSTKPYDAKTVNDTLDALSTYPTIEYHQLQDLIDPILEQSQQADFETYWKNRSNFDKRIHEVRWDVDPSANRELVRDINNVEVIVAKNHSIKTSPWAYPAISIPQGTLWKFRKEGGTVYGLFEQEDKTEMGYSTIKDFRIEPLGETASLPSSRVVVEPNQCAYSKSLGLQLGKKGKEVFMPEVDQQNSLKTASYQEEHYHLHLKRIYQQKAVRAAPIDALKRLLWLNDKNNFTKVNNIDVVIDIMIWSHDIAKLAKGWQDAHGSNSIPLAHGNRKYSPPPHAMESIVATEELIAHLLSNKIDEDYDVVVATVMAICTHHSPQYNPAKRSPTAFTVEQKQQEYLWSHLQQTESQIIELIKQCWQDLEWSFDGSSYYPPDRTTVEADTLYALLVYILRRCDGLATSLVSELLPVIDKNHDSIRINSNII